MVSHIKLIAVLYQGGGRGWVAKEAPKVVAGTVCKLVHRLTFHRVIGKSGVNKKASTLLR